MRLRVLESKIGQFAVMFFTEMVSFFIIVANTRAYTHDNYFWTAVTDILFSLQAFVISKLMVEQKEARSWYSGIGMTIGGTCGSLLAIFVTKRFY